jgi:hypothetical protein
MKIETEKLISLIDGFERLQKDEATARASQAQAASDEQRLHIEVKGKSSHDVILALGSEGREASPLAVNLRQLRILQQKQELLTTCIGNLQKEQEASARVLLVEFQTVAKAYLVEARADRDAEMEYLRQSLNPRFTRKPGEYRQNLVKLMRESDSFWWADAFSSLSVRTRDPLEGPRELLRYIGMFEQWRSQRSALTTEAAA